MSGGLRSVQVLGKEREHLGEQLLEGDPRVVAVDHFQVCLRRRAEHLEEVAVLLESVAVGVAHPRA